MIDYRTIIKQKRIYLKLSQAQLAKMVGISQPFMAEIESGRKSPSVDVFLQICETLEIPVFPDENKKK